MSATRPIPASRPDAKDGGRWPLWRLGLLLYPAVLAAVWINLFMLSLLGTWLDLSNLSPLQALLAALLIALPADYAAARWLRRLLDRANAE